MSAQPPHFFIVGAERSGTTLLRTLLESHPDVVVAPETHFVPAALRAADPVAAAEAIVAHRRWAQFDLDAEALRSHAAAPGRTPVDVVRWVFERYAAARGGATFVGDKTPNYAEQLRLLAATFPAARFIHLVRDPRPVVSSVLRQGWDWAPTTAGAVAVRRARHVTAARRDGRSLGPRYRELRYRALVADPEGHATSLLEWLGVPEPAARRDRSVVASNVTREIVDPDSHTNLTKSIRDRSTWREDLTPFDRLQVFVVTVGEEGGEYWSLTPRQAAVALVVARTVLWVVNAARRLRDRLRSG